MQARPTLTCILALAAPGLAAAQGGLDPRSNGMGGAQVSSASYRNAGFANPALLTRGEADDGWGLVLPTLSLFAADPDKLADMADAFANEFDRIEAIFDSAGTPTQSDLDNLANSLLGLDNRALVANASFGLGFARPSEELGFALVFDNRLSARSNIDVDPGDAAAISASAGGGALPDLNSTANVVGALETNIGVALARAFNVQGRKLSVGITPKAQTIETYNYRVDANTFDDDEQDEFTDDQYRRDESAFNLDAGLLLEATEQLTFGLAVRNLVSRDVKSVATLGRQFTYHLEPTATLGVSHQTGALLLAADIDLTKTDPFDFAPGSQFLSLGGEMGWEWGQLRAGYRLDMESEVENIFTAGAGFSPWDVFHLDLAGSLGDDTYGASIQLGWTF